MEIKNQTAYTRQAIIDAHKQQSAGNIVWRDNLGWLIGGILNVGPLIWCIRIILQGRGTYLTYILCAILLIAEIGCIFFLLLPLVFTFCERRVIKREAAQKRVYTYVFAEEEFTLQWTEQDVYFAPYEDILKVTETPPYFFLHIRKDRVLIVSKAGFTEGTEQDFRDLLRTVIEAKKLQIK